MNPSINTYINKRFIGPEGLAEYLDIRLNTVRSWVWQKKIPYVKMGRLVKFDLREVDEWLKDRHVKAMIY